MGRKALIACVAAILAVSACEDPEMADMARPDEIRMSAERCGLKGFDGNRAGAYRDANVPHDVEDWIIIEDCIYSDLERNGLRATRALNIYEWDAAREASKCRRDPSSGACIK